ncbi:unnamed protein product [Hapterophycus canaliculatus]
MTNKLSLAIMAKALRQLCLFELAERTVEHDLSRMRGGSVSFPWVCSLVFQGVFINAPRRDWWYTIEENRCGLHHCPCPLYVRNQETVRGAFLKESGAVE